MVFTTAALAGGSPRPPMMPPPAGSPPARSPLHGIAELSTYSSTDFTVKSCMILIL